MKNLFFTQVLLISIAFNCQTQPATEATLIAIKPLSMSSDKPIDSLFISFDKRLLPRPADWRDLVVTDRSTFQSTDSYILKNKSTAQASNNTHFEDGIFEVDIYDHTLLVTSYKLKSHYASKQYLNDLINVLDGRNSDYKLLEELRTLLTRINY